MEPGSEERGWRRQRGLDDDSARRLFSQSCGSNVDGARSSPVQTQAADATRAKAGRQKPGGREREEEEV